MVTLHFESRVIDQDGDGQRFDDNLATEVELLVLMRLARRFLVTATMLGPLLVVFMALLPSR